MEQVNSTERNRQRVDSRTMARSNSATLPLLKGYHHSSPDKTVPESYKEQSTQATSQTKYYVFLALPVLEGLIAGLYGGGILGAKGLR